MKFTDGHFSSCFCPSTKDTTKSKCDIELSTLPQDQTSATPYVDITSSSGHDSSTETPGSSSLTSTTGIPSAITELDTSSQTARLGAPTNIASAIATSHKHAPIGAIIGGIGAFIFLVLVAGLILWRRRKKIRTRISLEVCIAHIYMNND
jgi:hypothetical protein